jgi:hypothetical protein
MSKTYIQQKIKTYSNPDKAAVNLAFNMVHCRRTVSPEELQRRRDDLARIIKADTPNKAAEKILDYMSSRQLTFLRSSNPELLQKGSHKPAKEKKATARFKSYSTDVVLTAKASQPAI